MGRLNDVDDELWDVAINAVSNSLDEAIDDVRADLAEDDEHGHFVLNTLSRGLHDRIQECSRE
jgi:hypothetical protein